VRVRVRAGELKLMITWMAGPSDQNLPGGKIPRGDGLRGCVDALVSNTGPSVKKQPGGLF
jgi:hypothetical protein